MPPMPPMPPTWEQYKQFVQTKARAPSFTSRDEKERALAEWAERSLPSHFHTYAESPLKWPH